MPTTTAEIVIGTAQVLSYNLFLGISIGLFIIVFAIVVGRGHGGAYITNRIKT